jgi:undecaprenyl-diphosphatase
MSGYSSGRTAYLNWLDIIILGVVQGLTEFLPVSSTGHLMVTESLLGFTETKNLLGLDIFLHIPTILAVIIYFRSDIAAIFGGIFSPANPDARKKALRLIAMLALSVVATGIVYVIFKKGFEDAFSDVRLVGGAFLVTAVILGITSVKREGLIVEDDLRVWQALVIGAAQGIAITPGISRSGITICAALLIGMTPASAFRYSFLLAIPTIIIAWLADLVGEPGALAAIGSGPGALGAGFVVAFAAALAAILLLKKAVILHRLWIFSIYLVIIGIVTLAVVAK